MKKHKIKRLIFILVLVLCAYSLLGCSAPDVEKLRESGNIKGLINALGYDNDDEQSEVRIARRNAVWQALVEIGIPAVDPLIDALDNKNINIVRFAIGILGDIKDPRAVVPIIECLDDAKLEDVSIEALCKIGDASAANSLLAYIDRDIVANGGLIEININYMKPVVSGKGVIAAKYQPNTPGTHPVVIMDEHDFSSFRTNPSEDDPPNWNELMPISWRSLGAPELIELVLCWDKIEDKVLETSKYTNGVTGTRVREVFNVTLREAATGNIVMSDTILGKNPLELHTFSNEKKDFIKYGAVTVDILTEWLRKYVER